MNSFHDHGEDLAGAYALGALSDEEGETFEAHLTTCVGCRREVAELLQVVSALPLAVDLVEPPASLRNRVLAGVSEDSAPVPFTVLPGDRPARPHTSSTRFRSPNAALLAIAAVLVAALGLWNLNLRQQVNQQPSVALQPILLHALADGASASPVAPTGQSRTTTAALVQPRHGVALLVIGGISAAPSHKVYQLWLLKPHQAPRSAGTFSGSGGATQVWRLSTSARGYSRTAVTIEPGPQGSSQPTGAPILLGNLSA